MRGLRQPGRRMSSETGARRGERAGRLDLRPWAERRLRRAWATGGGPLLRAAALIYGAAAEARNFLHDAGVSAALRPPVPVLSVGGLTVGGSGKTPLTSDLADRLQRPDREVGVVTHGFADELQVHRRLRPDRIVEGGRARTAAVARAAAAGADLVVVDSGFQRRRLARSIDIVAVSAAETARARRRLPAGPLREGWSALGRAEGVVLTRRPGSPSLSAGPGSWLGEHLPDTAIAACELRPGQLVPSNSAARHVERPDPAVAVASVMHPEPFFRALRDRGMAPEVAVRVSDHGLPSPAELDELVRRAGSRGMVGTLKDMVKLEGTVGEATPLWHLRDALEWTGGRRTLIERIERILEEDA